MTEARFQRLSELVKGGVATLEEQVEILNHADALRDAMIESVTDRDQWDQDCPVLGYEYYVDGEDNEARAKRRDALRHRHRR